MDHCILHIEFIWCQMSLFMTEVDLIDRILRFPKAQVTSNKMVNGNGNVAFSLITCSTFIDF